jgi:hypothetical protein
MLPASGIAPKLSPVWKHCPGVGKPFILSERLSPVPHTLVWRILQGEYVDMVELLRDNLEAQRRSSSQRKGSSSNLFSWVQCFGTDGVVVTRENVSASGVLDARFGGKGWLAYVSWEQQS